MRKVLIVVLLALMLCALLWVARGCRDEGPGPLPPTVTVTAQAPTKTPRPTATVTPTLEPTDTLEPPTETPEPATPVPPTVTSTVVAPTPRPTATPIVIKGRVTVRPGDTLWGIACNQYPEFLGYGGCTCWPGLHAASKHIQNPRLIYPEQWVYIPRTCIR